jgi:hypothetical protein
MKLRSLRKTQSMIFFPDSELFSFCCCACRTRTIFPARNGDAFELLSSANCANEFAAIRCEEGERELPCVCLRFMVEENSARPHAVLDKFKRLINERCRLINFQSSGDASRLEETVIHGLLSRKSRVKFTCGQREIASQILQRGPAILIPMDQLPNDDTDGVHVSFWVARWIPYTIIPKCAAGHVKSTAAERFPNVLENSTLRIYQLQRLSI